MQKHLKGRLSTGGATYVRFLYALPFALIYCWSLFEFGGYALPQWNWTFLAYCLAGGVSQIIFTFVLIYLFSFRNFAVGTTLSKTEVVQIALLGLILLGDTLSAGAAVAIGLSLIGVMALSLAQSRISIRNLFSGLTEKATLIGLLCGAFLGASVVFFRGAGLSLGDGPAVMRAAFALAVSLVMQTIIMGAYLKWREPGEITKVVRNWAPALSVGVSGVLASICWFTAFTLQNAAYVRAVGQIELVFTFIASIFFFKEKTTPMEYLGIGLVVAAILTLILAR
ncbi:MAG: EamA family transporter [Rhodospirillaceae bacterium]|nr:EamA family transporter [Rhodospirillaceae bacterium]